MGHESIDTTTRFYGHLYPEHLHAAVEGVFSNDSADRVRTESPR